MCSVLLPVFKRQLHERFLLVINALNIFVQEIRYHNWYYNWYIYEDINRKIVLRSYVIKYSTELLSDFLYLNLLET